MASRWTAPGRGSTLLTIDSILSGHDGSRSFDRAAAARRNLGDLYVKLANKYGTAQALRTPTNLVVAEGEPLDEKDLDRIAACFTGTVDPRA